MLFLSVNLQAQNTPYTSATSFFTTYLEWGKNIYLTNASTGSDTNVYSTLYLCGANASCVKISIPGLAFEAYYNVPKDSVVAVTLPYNPKYTFVQPQNRTIFMDATTPIALLQGTNIGQGGANYGLNTKTTETEATALSPGYLIDRFYIFGMNSWALSKHFSIPSAPTPTNQANISIVFAEAASLNMQAPMIIREFNFTGPPVFLPNVPFVVNGVPGDVSSFFFHDGTYNTCCLNYTQLTTPQKKRFKIFLNTYDIRGSVTEPPVGHPNVFEETKSPDFFSYSFHAAPLEQQFGNQYSLFALQDSTVLTFANGATKLLDSLGRLDTCAPGPLYVSSNKPMQGYMAPCPNKDFNKNQYSPFAVALSGDNELVKKSIFATLNETDPLNNYVLGIVTKTKNRSLFTLDGVLQNPSLFTPFVSDTAWCWANFYLTKGTHIAQSDSGFHGIQYTWYEDTTKNKDVYVFPSYGYVLPEAVSWPEDSLVHRVGLNAQNVVAFSSFNSPICQGESLFLQPSQIRNTTWQIHWDNSKDTTLRANANAAMGIILNFSQPGQYWLSVRDSMGCSPADSVLITVLPKPTAEFTIETDASCQGTFFKLQNQSTGATNYSWQWPGGASTAINPNFSYTGADSTFVVTLVATDGNCSDTASKTISLQTQTFDASKIPNVFSPNNDGLNDAFCIANTAGFTDCYQLEIFNRWGSRVFATKNPQECWQGENAVSGVYFYVLKIGQQTYNGQVTVFK